MKQALRLQCCIAFNLRDSVSLPALCRGPYADRSLELGARTSAFEPTDMKITG